MAKFKIGDRVVAHPLGLVSTSWVVGPVVKNMPTEKRSSIRQCQVYGYVGPDCHSWYCDEEEAYLLSENVTEDQIEAIKRLLR